ncbi:MAG TPA: protein kinase, partial [Cyanobacteria bacterium UBA8530]|nr:protein kinase [Cyanobacteria bacterium UBA8530]
MRDKLESTWALKPLSLERLPEGLALVLEDFGGFSLDSLVFPLEMGRSLAIAVRLSVAIASMHERGLVHKDLKPSNIFLKEDPNSCEVKLTGFAIASLLSSEEQALRPPNLIEGTLVYMSPEQTGRMNRSLDSRTDLYSCGVILYQLLTGFLPCEGLDALELMHCLVAVQPKPPVERNGKIPQPLSDLVLKLLAKAPEERYQTATSLRADLERCRAQWKDEGRIEAFPLGERDLSERFRIPQRLYGRDQEIAELLKAYERVSSRGDSEFLLVSGYSGIGKTSLVKELYQPILRDRAFFLAGKFDQYKRDIPYSTIVQAFRECVQQLLAESAPKVAEWREKLQAAVGINGQLIVDVIPQVGLLLGTQPPVLELPLTEAQNRFNLVFRNFVGVFAQPEHPLVLFLDDLQWADSASLKLIRNLITDPETRFLFLIGAYRDNEVSPAHPLMLTLEEIRKDGVVIREIVLLPLSLRDLNRLIADSLHEGAGRTEPLAALVYEKTGGNPFFFVQFLKNLHGEALVRFDRSKAAWTWDLAAIEAMGFTDNVVDFLVGKLKKLPTATQLTLKLFACAGNKVEAPFLAAICQETESEIARDLEAAISEGLVLPAEDAYRFLHDRIQQAAYSLIPEEDRKKIHLRIGRLLAVRGANLEEIVFDIVSQYDLGASLILDSEEQQRVAELNLMAGRKALASSAYLPALAYLSAGLTILPDDVWENRYPLVFALHFEKAECEYLTGNFEETERLLFQLLAKARDDLDKATVYRLMVDFYTTTDNIGQAIERGMQCLALFGIELSVHPSREELVAAHDEVWQNLGGRSIEELLDLPLMTSREMRIVLEILSVLKTSALYTDLNLFGLIGCVSVNISLRFGNADASTMGYALFGSALGSHFGDYRNGYRFGKLAYDLVEKNGYR